jgi:hypothetical protein
MTYREFFSPRFNQALSELMLITFETDKAIEIDNFYEERKKKFEQFQKVSKEQLAKFNGEIIDSKYVFNGKEKEKDLKDYEELTNRYLDKELDFPILKIKIKVEQISAMAKIILYSVLKPTMEIRRVVKPVMSITTNKPIMKII